MSKQEKDFPSPPQFFQVKMANAAWVNVTVTKTEADGTITQVSTIVAKPR